MEKRSQVPSSKNNHIMMGLIHELDFTSMQNPTHVLKLLYFLHLHSPQHSNQSNGPQGQQVWSGVPPMILHTSSLIAAGYNSSLRKSPFC
jgi:hypothetical protein